MSTARKLAHFIGLRELDADAFEGLLERAAFHKVSRRSGATPLKGKTLGTAFLNPSLRTRTSTLMAMRELGGEAVDFSPSSGTWPYELDDGAVMDGTSVEHLKDAVRVMSRYCDALGVRAAGYVSKERRDRVLNLLLRYATVPVINLESDWAHPCQGLADALALRQAGLGRGARYVYTWTPHPKPLPQATTHSQLFAAAHLGMHVTLAHPRGWELDGDVVAALSARAAAAGGSFEVVHDRGAALREADVVASKSWGALSMVCDPAAEAAARAPLGAWALGPEAFGAADPYYMHCLPVRRNVEVADAVLDGPRSLIYEQAENRLHAQKAVLEELL